MARYAHEFQCDGNGTWGKGGFHSGGAPSENCGWYNYPMLDSAMNGNYVIQCGHCGHKHYRVIKDGVVTSDRHKDGDGVAELIYVMPSACSKEKRQLGAVAQLRQLEVAGLATSSEQTLSPPPSSLVDRIKARVSGKKAHNGMPKDEPA